MATTTSFEEWLETEGPEGHEELDELHMALRDEEDIGTYECSRKDARLFVKGPNGDTLLLASDAAKAAFLEQLRATYCGDMDIEGWVIYMRAMAKDDS